MLLMRRGCGMNKTRDMLARCHLLALAGMQRAASTGSTPGAAPSAPPSTAGPSGDPLSARERALLSAFGPAHLAKIESVLMRLPPAPPAPPPAPPAARPGVLGVKPTRNASSWRAGRRFLVTRDVGRADPVAIARAPALPAVRRPAGLICCSGVRCGITNDRRLYQEDLRCDEEEIH